MRRVIFGALTVAVTALAAIGIIGRRRWAMRDDALPLEPAPPLGLGVTAGAAGAVTAGAAGAVGAEHVLEAAPAPSTPSGPSAGPADGPDGVAAPRQKAKPSARPRRKAATAPAPTIEGDAATS
jgi:hypothetical protein